MIQVEDHIGCVASVAYTWWRKLPRTIQAWYDVDDMIGDCVIQLTRSKDRYTTARGRPSTFVYALTTNHCRQILEHFSQGKRKGVSIPIEILNGSGIRSISVPSSEVKLRRRQAAEEVLRTASDDLRDVLSMVLEGRRVCKSDIRRVSPEARTLVRRYNLSNDDVVAAFSGGV